MDPSHTRIVLRHLSGSRATETDVIAVGAHRELILGRATSAAVRFDPHRDPHVGRQHARLEQGERTCEFRIADLASRNGTWVNGVRVRDSVALRTGDIIRLGQSGPELEFTLEIESVLAGEAGAAD
jgi:pSer/pThr/pTyr-binding forkhead associated (FHA) protein